MKKFIVGVIFGILLGTVASAYAAQMMGENGYLHGWDVVKEGETLCSDPYVWMSTREIECD